VAYTVSVTSTFITVEKVRTVVMVAEYSVVVAIVLEK
jgi:hypothetical protein